MGATIFENIYKNIANPVYKAHLPIRLDFIRKVYGLLFVQVLITFLVCALFYLNNSSIYYVTMNKWHRDVAMILSFVLIGMLYMKRQNSPLNMYLLLAYTLTQAYIIGTTLIFYKARIVLQSLFLTMGALFGLNTYAIQTDKDFTKMKQILNIGIWTLMIGGLLQIFYPLSGLELILSYLGVIVFSLYLIHDIQNIMTRVSPEEYVFATICLYMDIINLFLHIVKLLQNLEKKQKRRDN